MAVPVREAPAPIPDKIRAGVTWRSVLIGIASTALIDLWIHNAELILGGQRGHTALANTSIPVGAFNVLFVLVLVNAIVTTYSPSLKLSQPELLTIYVMSAVSTVLSSSGGLHFLIPTITAVHYFATPENRWAELFHAFIPDWLVQSDPTALKSFYAGQGTFELSRWLTQIFVWTGFLLVFACATLCLVLILRKQWIEREHLPFPTVALALEVSKEGSPVLTDRLFWIAAGATFAIVWWNTLAFNFPTIPLLNLRAWDLTESFTTPPWNAIGKFRLSFFPFAIGIGYLLSTEVVFSCWFFYLFSKAQLVWGAAAGWSTGGSTGAQSVFPYLQHQGAGAFLGLALASIWVSRRHFAEVFRAAFSGSGKVDSEAKGYRVAVLGLLTSVAAMIVFAVAAGASAIVAVVFVVLALVYLIAATRIRAETGSAWPMGPEVDAFRLMIAAGGTSAYGTSDLTALTYVRAATAGQDFRGVCMPHQLDGFKMAESTGIRPSRLAWAMVAAVGLGVAVSFVMALMVWSRHGALAGTEVWRSMKGKQSFDLLATWLKTPVRPDSGGMLGIGMGMGFAMFLAYMRMLYVWWPFHPVGYCISNTFTASNGWMPFFVAWLVKVVIVRAGGMRLYRRAIPFFLGMIAGDFLGGGTTTLLGCLGSMNVYPMNW